MLTHETTFDDHFPEGEEAGIGVIDTAHKNKLDIIAHTKTWNWQQGAMLQWHPSKGNIILYNDLIESNLACVLYDITTGAKKILTRPVAAVNHAGTSALSINFSRLYDLRKDYGYAGPADPWHDKLSPDNDGIYAIDLNTGAYKLIVSIHQVAHYNPEMSFRGVKHWINHLAYNQDDTRFCFLHRYEIPQAQRFGTRLFTARCDGSDLRCLWSNHVSHFDWRDRTNILAWAVKSSPGKHSSRLKSFALTMLKRNQYIYRRLKTLSLLRTRIYGGGFFLFKDCREMNYQIIGKGHLTQDGHCTFSPDRKWILVDTYPDIKQLRHIYLYNVAQQNAVHVGQFHDTPVPEPYLRCDLHPRWDRTGTTICLDSTHDGTRQMYILDVAEVIQPHS
jgi:hypothetical protein